MKKVLRLPVFLGLLPAMAAFGAAETAQDEMAAARAEVVAYFEGPNDPFIEKAVWSSPRLLNVGAHYMGSDESPLARDVCRVLRQHGVDVGTEVRVIDINTMGEDSSTWEIVGLTRCR